jgi:hypothetical protein
MNREKKNALAVVSRTLAAEYKGKPLCVLADVSGSMDKINESGMTRFAEMKAALCEAMKGRTDYSLIAFDDTLAVVKDPSALQWTAGGTMLAEALRSVRKQKPEHILIVTDGHPTDNPPESCLDVLDNDFPWVRVDVLFVGNETDKWALALLGKVARNGGEIRTARKKYLGAVRFLLGERSVHHG